MRTKGFRPNFRSCKGSRKANGFVGTGQNARLAARLTGYKIDIKPQSYKDPE